ncbi:hypothetical protein LBMAG07_13150 [Actinomycetes bacterium]|nr:hypothetical protein LBMAG07_13150 [Actinomycetes bacterium]
MISNALRSISARTRGAVFFHGTNASWAMSTACKQSAIDAFSTVPIASPVAGFNTSIWDDMLAPISEVQRQRSA